MGIRHRVRNSAAIALTLRPSCPPSSAAKEPGLGCRENAETVIASRPEVPIVAKVNPYGAALVSGLQFWSKAVFGPALALEEELPDSLRGQARWRGGECPEPASGDGLGRRYSLRPGPHLDNNLATATVEDFDQMSETYEAYTQAFVDDLWEAAYDDLVRLLPCSKARVLDPSSGPGRHALRIAAHVAKDDGEVVAADLSARMVERVSWAARAEGRTNMAFYQLDVEKGHPDFTHNPSGKGFDLIYSCLSFHHYVDALCAAEKLFGMLAPSGKIFIVDGGTRWFKRLARPISELADPGFVRHRTIDEFRELFRKALGIQESKCSDPPGYRSEPAGTAMENQWKFFARPLLPGMNLVVVERLSDT